MDGFGKSAGYGQTRATGTENWLSGVRPLLVFSTASAGRLMDAIGWGREDFPRNRREQGGWLIGRYIRDTEGNPVQAEVTHILEADTECRRPGYIEWDAMEEIRLQQEFFRIKDELEKTDAAMSEELAVLGWWHTHPNELPVFLSSTDMETVRLKYYKPEKYSVVINPHKGVIRAFAGASAVEVPAIMLLGGDEKKVRAGRKKNGPDRNTSRKKLKRKKKNGRNAGKGSRKGGKG